ncbi:uncharacterized [Tachysurus ichikawai]
MRLNYNPSPYTRTHPDCPTLPYIDGQRGGHRLDERRSSAGNCISAPVAPALADGQVSISPQGAFGISFLEITPLHPISTPCPSNAKCSNPKPSNPGDKLKRV